MRDRCLCLYMPSTRARGRVQTVISRLPLLYIPSNAPIGATSPPLQPRKTTGHLAAFAIVGAGDRFYGC